MLTFFVTHINELPVARVALSGPTSDMSMDSWTTKKYGIRADGNSAFCQVVQLGTTYTPGPQSI